MIDSQCTPGRATPSSPERSYPVVLATRRGSLLTFWCPWCRRQHYHGAHGCHDPQCACTLHQDYRFGWDPCTCPIGTGNGHRCAHCTEPSSPFKATGYIVREVAR